MRERVSLFIICQAKICWPCTTQWHRRASGPDSSDIVTQRMTNIFKFCLTQSQTSPVSVNNVSFVKEQLGKISLLWSIYLGTRLYKIKIVYCCFFNCLNWSGQLYFDCKENFWPLTFPKHCKFWLLCLLLNVVKEYPHAEESGYPLTLSVGFASHFLISCPIQLNPD